MRQVNETRSKTAADWNRNIATKKVEEEKMKFVYMGMSSKRERQREEFVKQGEDCTRKCMFLSE